MPLCLILCCGLFWGVVLSLCFLGVGHTASDRLDDYNLAYNLTMARIWRYIVVLERCLFFSAILHYRLWGFAAGLVNGLDMDPSTPHRNHMESKITWRETVSCNFRQAQGYEDVVKNLPLIDQALGQRMAS